MKKPNFFIIGAPKCGTTSLAAWLAAHEQVFVSPVKEPHHFNTDAKTRAVADREHYEALFREASPEHIAVGEASTGYLFSRAAIGNILAYDPQARFIALVRNPLELVQSLHEQRHFQGQDNVKDFERAWRLQEDRRKGQRIPLFCPDPVLLQYGEWCRLGEQIERFFMAVPEEKRLVVVHDDLKQNPEKELGRIVDFLGIAQEGLIDIPVLNAAKEYSSRFLANALAAASWLKRASGIRGLGFGLLTGAAEANRRRRRRPELPEGLRRELVTYFRDDVRGLGALLGRELDHWLE